ncbi:hypothetical protein ONS95_008148 [Cadophora gregata]|uniref:uncharacterized protein n=1 Tax=Cadophora gregata TaxID=51156 RepID=UPI0026DB6F38|nr:uncharacterized protein ONS95_008148 [Cadophora gregata]KAK0119302.1 hypothetical protein ONS96_012359 [Cadophora gregata f. sp. sojae]KAK0126558.1 hypothetical protein ONS95_008148 [Cadophora gregata]
MSNNTDAKLAGAALAIALVALATAVGQLLQQYFSTADGYRRCHKYVMGEYARKTRLHWRWREFRFETLYTIPEISLVGDGALSRRGQVLLTGSKLSREKSLVPVVSMDFDEMLMEAPQDDYVTQYQARRGAGRRRERLPAQSEKKKKGNRGELACWVPFLHWIHENTQACLDHEELPREMIDYPDPNLRLPAVVFRERSWAFQPPDVVRPLAKTTLSDIAVLARRMGMKWKDFRPSDGILRAEGHSHIITSTVVRSLGIVLQYSYTGRNQRLRMAEQNHFRKRLVTGSILPEQEEIYIPRASADRLGCGVVRTEPLLGLPDLTVSTQSEIVAALSYLDRSGSSSAALSQILKENPEFRFRVADLVALTTQPSRYRGSCLVQIPAPSENVHGVTTSSVGRRAFRLCLEEYVVVHHKDVGPYTLQALQICHDIGTKYAAWDHTDEYSLQDESWVVTRDPRYLDLVQDTLTTYTKLLNEWEQQHSFRYHHLLRIHIKHAVFKEDGETSMLRNLGADYKADVDGYFRVLPQIVEEMRKTGFHDRQMIVDAWVVMMMRAFCWGACHFFVPGERVPIEYFGSQLPVYMG